MRRAAFFAIALALLLAGLWYADTRLAAPPPAATATPMPAHTPEPAPPVAAPAGPRVVVLSLAGAGAGRVAACLADGTMPHLARLQEEGAAASYALSVDPPLAAPAHAALATGTYPEESGVVADRYHRSPADLNRVVEAVASAPLAAEPVWRTAMREARPTAALFWPGLSLDEPLGLPDYALTRGAVDAPAAQHVVTLTRALSWADMPASFSPPLEGTLTITKRGAPLMRVHVLAVDSADDGREEYDAFYLDRVRQVSPASARLQLGGTAPLLLDEHVVSGAYFTLTQADPGQITIYQSEVRYNEAQPDELVREVNRRFGFLPPDPDGAALRQGWIGPDQYLRAAEIQSQWMISATTYVLATYRPELLYTWQGPIEAVQREFLPADPAQPGYTPEQAADSARCLRRGYALADAAAGRLAEALDLTRATLFVVSGGGAAPVHTQVNLNALLAEAGFLACEPGAIPRLDAMRTRAFALGSGGTAHLYLNLRGRERAGTVPQADYDRVRQAVTAALEAVTAEDGQPALSRVLRREELAELHLAAPTAGDLLVQAAPGFALSDALVRAPVLAPAEVRGQAGYQATSPEMLGLFLAVGRGVRQGAQAGPVHVLDLVPTVSRLLGLEPRAELAGRPLEEMLLP